MEAAVDKFETLVDTSLERLEVHRADRKLTRLDELCKELDQLDSFLTNLINEHSEQTAVGAGSSDSRT